MSFGFYLNDFGGVIKLSWRLYEALKDGPQEITILARDLTTVYGVLSHIEDDLESNDSAIKANGEERLKMLQAMTTGLKTTLEEVQKLVDKFKPIAARSKTPEQLWIQLRYLSGQRNIK